MHDVRATLESQLSGRYQIQDALGAGGMSTVILARDLRHDRDVADALDYAHRHQVVHRDTKPENILLHEGHAVVADFGIGKAVLTASSVGATFTQVGVTVWTPAYMSPEQAAGEEVDGRSDLFALGCVLYEMLTGEVACAGPTVQATIARRFVHTPPNVSTVRPDVPGQLAMLVDRLLETAAIDRIASGEQVVSSLSESALSMSPTPAPRSNATRSIVVLPFENVSPDADNAFVADGLAEEIITDLSQVKTLRVISRTTAMQYRSSTQSLRAIGAERGVRRALTGTVRRAGSAPSGRSCRCRRQIAPTCALAWKGSHWIRCRRSPTSWWPPTRGSRMELAEHRVNMGFCPHAYITRQCPFYAPLRGAAGFERVAGMAAERAAQVDASFSV